MVVVEMTPIPPFEMQRVQLIDKLVKELLDSLEDLIPKTSKKLGWRLNQKKLFSVETMGMGGGKHIW